MHVELPEKRYYGIGEVAKAFGVNTSLIRFWEKEFDALKPKKNAKGNRKFTPQEHTRAGRGLPGGCGELSEHRAAGGSGGRVLAVRLS